MPLFPTGTDTTIQDPQVPDTEPITPEVEENTNIPYVSFIVEDGSIVPLANSYCNLDFADEYAANKGNKDWLQLSDEEKQIYIIKGTEFVDNYFDWRGVRKSQMQSLSFPRCEIYDDDNYPVIGIPEKLKKACVEAAIITSNSASESLFATKDEAGKVKRQKVDTLEVEYFEGKENSTNINNLGDTYTSIYGVLNYLLKGLYKTKNDNGSSICTRAIWEF